MQKLPTHYSLRARYVFPVDGAPVANGVVTVAAENIFSVTASTSNPVTIDLGDAAILPGLVNAHAHLEFSDLDRPLGHPGIALTEWIGLILDYRRDECRAPYAQRVATGVAQSIRHGTTTVGDIVTADGPAPRAPLDVAAFRELICTDPEGVADASASAQRYLATHTGGGVSPHATYSVHPDLWDRCVAMARQQRIPLASHIAESPDEMRWLRSGDGPLANWFAERSVPLPPLRGEKPRPLDFLRRLADAGRALVIHGNYLDSEEIDFIAEHRDTLSVVYCPRTHTFFQHQPYPLGELRAAGANIALGTDGRCSNPDLSILAEMRHVSAQHPDVPLDRILAMGTVGGATALGRSERIGTITPGKHANLTIVRLPDDHDGDPHTLLLHSDQPVIATIYRGQPTFAARASGLTLV